MKHPGVSYVVVGGFVLTALAGLITAILMITGRTGATDTYTTVYSNVAGVTFGTQVLFEGYPIGQVVAITPEHEADGTRFRVALDVEQDWPIPTDSLVRITASGLLSAYVLDIRAGAADRTLPPGSEIPSAPPGDVFAVVQDVAAEVQALSAESIRPLLDQIRGYLDTIGAAASRDVPAMLADARSLAAELAVIGPRIAGNLEAFSQRLDRDVLGPDTARRIDTTLVNIERFSADIATLAANLEQTRQRATDLVDSLNTLVQDNRDTVDTGLGDLRYTLASLSRGIDSILHNLDGAARNMNEFSRAIRRNPSSLLRAPEPGEDAR